MDGSEGEIDLSKVAGESAEVKLPQKSHRSPDISQIETQNRINQASRIRENEFSPVTNQTPTERVHTTLRSQKGADQDQKANMDLTMQNFDVAVRSGRLGQFEVLEAKGVRGNRVLKLKDPQTGHNFLMQEGQGEIVNLFAPTGKTPIDRTIEVLLRAREDGIGKFSDQERNDILKEIEKLPGVAVPDRDRLREMVTVRIKLDDLVTARGTAIWAYDQSRKARTEADKKKFKEESQKEAAVYDPKDFVRVDKKTKQGTITDSFRVIRDIPGVAEALQALNKDIPDYYKDSSKAGDDKRKVWDVQIRDAIRVDVFAQEPEFNQLGPVTALDLAQKLMIVSGRAEKLGLRGIPSMKAEEMGQTGANLGQWMADFFLGLVTGK